MLSIPARLLEALASRRFATALILSWMGLVIVWIVPFEFYALPNEQIQRIVYHEWFFLLVYALLAVSTLACILPRALRQSRRALSLPHPGSRPRLAGGSAVPGATFDAALAEQALEAGGYAHVTSGEGWAWGVRNRWSPLGSTLFHLSILAFVVAIAFANDTGRTFVGRVPLVEGETFTGLPSQYASIESTGPGARPAPPLRFKVTSIRTSFHRDLLLFTELSTTLEDEDGREVRMSLSDPWIPDAATMVAVEDFGYAVEVVAAGKGSTETAPVVYKLKAFPSGTTDTFDTEPIGEAEYRVTVQVYGDYVDRDGEPGTRSFNLADPRLRIDLARILSTRSQKVLVEDLLVRIGEPVEFGDARLTFTGIREYGVFRVSRSDAAPFVLAALLLLVTGVAVRLLLPRREALVAGSEAGTAVLVLDDAYGRLPGAEARLAESLERRR